MRIDFESMNEKMKKLYSALWADNEFISNNANLIEQSMDSRYKNHSHNSYCFAGTEDTEELLTKIFGIKEPEKEPKLFKEKFDMAVSGSGQELRKITTLHSSSLCALLHFYNVTEDNPLILADLMTDKSQRTIKFTKSFFEYKSPVINNPSNMDVVLIGKDVESGDNIVFFLESKFSEYYTSASKKSNSISKKYLEAKYCAPLYKDEALLKMGLRKADINTNFVELISEKEPFYIDGIKQMISHYTGIRNVLNGNFYKTEKENQENEQKQNEINNAIKNGATVILGEIVFDRFIGDLELKPGLKCGEIYSQKYEELAKQIGELTKDVPKFEIMHKELGYSLFNENNHIIEDQIRQFYREK